MRIQDDTQRFKDNAIVYKQRRRRLWHWTGGSTAEGALAHLDNRMGGTGTVGYNYIICKSGLIHMLVNPHNGYMQSSGLGQNYDKNTIAIAFVMQDESSQITEAQYDAAKELIKLTNDEFEIFEDVHHAQVNKNKIDFPKHIWAEIKKRLKI